MSHSKFQLKKMNTSEILSLKYFKEIKRCKTQPIYLAIQLVPAVKYLSKW